ncbi:hypothetical protein BDY24DRAFT_415530 [Mrakia frigida]|uniref:uncharacterized protein n=1 Tax=Mrakia frigida TaxID=29902 RepID=UPI003FCC0E6A
MPSFTKLFSRKNSYFSSSIAKVDSQYETISPPTYADESLPTYQAKPAPRRIVLAPEDPMIVHARLLSGHARGGARHIKKA